MKRKRGHKKGKHKQSLEANAVHVNMEHCSVSEDQDDDTELDFETEIKAASPLETDKLGSLINTRADGCIDNLPVQGRVKVKLKSSKLLEPHRAHSDAQTQSDTDRSSSHLSLEKQEDLDKRNDSANVMFEIQPTVSGNTTRKAGSIKIKSSRNIGSLSTASVSLHGQGDRTAQSALDIHNIISKSQRKEHKVSYQEPMYNEKELNTALAVIRKIMKMDAAEPFNAPVDPVALGIPDYFDIIETPMDFGTICNKLEQSRIYKNSEDVYKDVQYIWENCYKYNNKGDYIVDLMKRVKKNFMKYWTAAGLYSNQSRSNVSEMETVAPSSQERVHMKSTDLKNKKRGRHGFNKHKNDCMCAVCVVRRRRKEREGIAKIVESQMEVSDGNASQEFKQEETSIENHCSEDASSNLGHSPDPDAVVDMEENDGEKLELERAEKKQNQNEMKEEKEIQKTEEIGCSSYQVRIGDGCAERNPRPKSEELEDSGIMIQKHHSQNGNTWHQEAEAIEIHKLQQKQDSPMMHQQTVMCEKLLLDRNPWIMKLCGTLFPDNHGSVWSGPHSLGHRHGDVRVGSGGGSNSRRLRPNSGIQAAVDTFIN